MADIQFWLSFNNGAERLRLPVNPEEITIGASHQFNDVNISQLGEYTVYGDPSLKTFEFSSFFPRDYNPTYCEYTNIPDPWEAIQLLEKWQKSRKPCRLTITGTPINYPVTIRSIDYTPERAGSPGDIYYSLSLKEFLFIEIKKVDTSTDSATVEAEKERPNPTEPPTTYIVKSGDNLSVIAARVNAKGVSVTWNDIYNANKGVIGKNPNLIRPGMELVIPNV